MIYANLRKVIHFLFSCNLSEILTIFAAIVLGCPAPLLPLQILWVNLVTDILPALALIRDPAEPEIMRRPPRDPAEALVTWRFGARMLARGGAARRRRAERVRLGGLARGPGPARHHHGLHGARPDPAVPGDELSLRPAAAGGGCRPIPESRSRSSPSWRCSGWPSRCRRWPGCSGPPR